MHRLEVTLEVDGAKLKDLFNSVTVMEKKGGDSVDTLAIKANIDILKKEVAALKYLHYVVCWTCHL